MIFIALTTFAFASYARTGSDTSVVFRFKARDDFFAERGNVAELRRLYRFVELHGGEINAGLMPVRVDGYCSSSESGIENRRIAAVRSNRVKAELITNKGLKEHHFVTRNHAESFDGLNDAVVVSFSLAENRNAVSTLPEQIGAESKTTTTRERPTTKPDPTQSPRAGSSTTQPTATDTQARPTTQQTAPDTQAQPTTMAPQPTETQARHEESETQPQREEPETHRASLTSVRTNLLYWLVALPNIGVEYMPTASLGLLLDGGWNHWTWRDENRQYRTWFVQPEVRLYTGADRRWFLGLEGHAGQFNFKFGDAGSQGETFGGGATGGYRLRLGERFDMEFSVGLGYSRLKYETYVRSHNFMVRREDGLKRNFFGPTRAGISLVWKTGGRRQNGNERD